MSTTKLTFFLPVPLRHISISYLKYGYTLFFFFFMICSLCYFCLSIACAVLFFLQLRVCIITKMLEQNCRKYANFQSTLS